MNLVDAEGVLREWCKLKLTEVAERVHFSMPTKDLPTLPMVVMYRTSGIPDHHGHDHPFITFEVWGENKHKAAQVAYKLASLIQLTSIDTPTVIGGGYVLGGTVFNGPRPMFPQPEGKRYRYEVGAEFMLRSA